MKIKPDSSWINDFYGQELSSEIQDLCDEGLTDPTIEDLVDAHLKINYSYFGAIDKTLAGFVILNSEGDNYTLYDARDGKQIWWQDHETREVHLHFDSIDDYGAYLKELKEAGEEADQDAIREAYQSGKPKSHRAVSSVDLLERYQWLVWALSQYLMHEGNRIQRVDEFCRSAIGHYDHTWPKPKSASQALKKELPELSKDPHLAIYWLLHTTLLAKNEERNQVLEAIGTPKNPLLRAFVDRFGKMGLDGSLEVLPDFRIRRSILVSIERWMYQKSNESAIRGAFEAFQIAPEHSELIRCRFIVNGLQEGILKKEEVKSALERHPLTSMGRSYLGAILDKLDGKAKSAFADQYVALALHAKPAPFLEVLAALIEITDLVTDTKKLLELTQWVLEKDPYSAAMLEIANRLAPSEELNARLTLSRKIVELYQKAHHQKDPPETLLKDVADPEVLHGFARRVLYRAGLDPWKNGMLAWAFQKVLAGSDSDRMTLVKHALSSVDGHEQTKLLEPAIKALSSEDDPVIELMLDYLSSIQEFSEDQIAERFLAKEAIEKMLTCIFPFAHIKEVFDRLMTILESHGPPHVVAEIYDHLMNPFEKGTYLLPKLSAEQALRVAQLMIQTMLGHSSLKARSSAGHQLFRFHHLGCESFLIQALDEYGERYARLSKERSKELEDTVANLYAAVRGLGTSASRQALIDRLFKEKRSYWRMADALKDIFSRDLHLQIMKVLAERKNPEAVGCYAYTLSAHVDGGASYLIDVLTLVLQWYLKEGEGLDLNPKISGFLKYAVIMGIQAAVKEQKFDLVRAAVPFMEAIATEALNPAMLERGREWKNPLVTDPELKKRIQQILAGEADLERQKTLQAAEKARSQGKPQLKISDKALGLLAGTEVQARIFHDKRTGELWFRNPVDAFFYFDGYSVTDPPFEIQRQSTQEFLKDATGMTDRAMFWNESAEEFLELQRYSRCLVLYRGMNNGQFKRLAIRCKAEDLAADYMRRFRENPPKGFRETDPYYLEGRGAIVRTYYTPLPDGKYNENGRAMIGVIDGVPYFSLTKQGLNQDAVSAHIDYEFACQKEFGGSLTCLEWMDRYRSDRDLSYADWMAKRIRGDQRDAEWHVLAIHEIHLALKKSGIPLKQKLEIEIGKPATPQEMMALQKELREPLSPLLVDFWKKIGHARWKLGKAEMRILSPMEVLKLRPAAVALGKEALSGMNPEQSRQFAQTLSHLCPLVIAHNGTVLSVFADTKKDEGRVFMNTTDLFRAEESLSWIFATGFLSYLLNSLAEPHPLLSQLFFGQTLRPATQRTRYEMKEGKVNKFWEILCDEEERMISVRFGKCDTRGTFKLKRYATSQETRKEYEKLVQSKKKKGSRKAL